jgi:hypothetical protein
MRRLITILATVATVGLGTRSALAWNDFGHMLVAARAYDSLTPSVKKKVDKLVALNPQYAHWVLGVKAKDKGKVAFMKAATWPDLIKRTGSGYVSDGPDGGFRPPSDSTASQNIGYSDTAMHKYWHFVDVPFAPPGDNTPLQQPPSVNAQTEIALLRAALRTDEPDLLKSYDLVWLEHLVGDIHQPLHCTSRFDAADPNGDAGGNNVKLTTSLDYTETVLHALWDDFPGCGDAADQAIASQSLLPKPRKKLAPISDEAKWIAEGVENAQRYAYATPIGVGDGPFQPDPPYLAAGKALSDARISLAGARLANLINDALTGPVAKAKPATATTKSVKEAEK